MNHKKKNAIILVAVSIAFVAIVIWIAWGNSALMVNEIKTDDMKENTLSYTTRIGKTTFIVNVKQSERAKKPLNTVFQEICRHEMLGVFSADNYLNLENLQKSS